jgi:hypothetical protein
MAVNRRKFFYPPRPGSGAGTFSDNIVGLQIVDGGGLTQGNFEFTTSITEKVDRNFNIGAFSSPITLEDLNISDLNESRRILASQFRVYPNYDISQVLNFSMYGSLSKRFQVSVTNIINKFPASLDVFFLNQEFVTGNTAENIVYNPITDETSFTINVNRILNPFGIDYSISASTNLTASEFNLSRYRNLFNTYIDYCVSINDDIFKIISFTPSQSLSSGVISFVASGSPFGVTATSVTQDYQIRPNDFIVDKIFSEDFDEVEKFLLNRLIKPEYTATFQVPQQNQDGVFFTDYIKVTFPKDGSWNLDIRSIRFEKYLEKLESIANNLDEFKTNLISRFLVTGSIKEFDTMDHKVEKILQIYGRSFDEVKKFIDALAYMNSVNYNPSNDIPSQLLVNLAETLGWSTNFSPITNENFLESIFGNTTDVTYPGYARALTPTEINYNFYRNLILNSAYLFKSKGTRRSIEFILRLIGAPDSLIEYNEYIYLADQKVNINDFDAKWAQISGGTYVDNSPSYEAGNLFKIKGQTFTAFTTTNQFSDVNLRKRDYPIDFDGYPFSPEDTDDFFFQKGAGWYEQTTTHTSPEQVTVTGLVYTGQNYDIQTTLQPFTYGQEYLDRYRKFPYMNEGFKLRKTIDNKKSWLSDDDKLRQSSNSDAYYFVSDERLILNVKNVDIFLNPAQGLVYDIWDESIRYDYPIPNTGLTVGYPVPGGVDSTFINPKPKEKTFFEFSQTFWENTINVRNRQYITDGKTGGYPTLQSIWWKYIQSESTVGLPNNKYTYQKLIEYVESIEPYWMKLVEQMVPATTIWNGGVRYENSILHKQKFVYRRQRGCQFVPVPADNCFIISDLFSYDCNTEIADYYIYPWLNGDVDVSNFSTILMNRLNNYLTSEGLLLTDCIQESLQTQWFIILKIGNQNIIFEKFYDGFGINDFPSNNDWRNSLIIYLPNLYSYGYNYSLNGNFLTITSLTSNDTNFQFEVSLDVGINLSINCN